MTGTTLSRTVEPASAEPASGERWFRADLDGLRAVAVVLVVAYHAGLPHLGGGFVGVDVFFVISGYLITRNLLREVDASRRVDLVGFWGRRIRRLVPALAVMLVVVLGLALVVQGPLHWESSAAQARAAALYVSNYYFASQPTGYFGADLSSNLFLHTWSLGVEEQFYVLWPLLFLATGLLARGRARAGRRVLLVALSAILALSFASSVALTRNDSSLAFFGLWSRAWEFAVAGLLALVGVPALLRRSWLQLAMVAAGLSMIVAAALMLSSGYHYPGVRALLPVLGTLLVVAGGERLRGEASNPLSGLLSIAPAQWLGRLSYSWYLWHWPLILLAVELLDRDSTKVRVAGAVVSLGVAYAAHRLVENPIRFGRPFVASRRLTYGGAAALTVVVLLASVGVAAAGRRTIADDPVLRVLKTAQSSRAQDAPCAAHGTSSDGLRYCIDGDVNADRTVVLFGDSHAGQWRLAFSDAAKAKGMRLVTIYRPACPSIPLLVFSPFNTAEECTEFQRQGAAAVADIHPDLVVISNTSNYLAGVIVPPGTPTENAKGRLWANAYTQLVEQLRGQGIAVAGVVDNPGSPDRDPIACIEDAHDLDACSLRPGVALVGGELRTGEAAAVAELDVPVLDVNGELCNDLRCRFVVDDVAVLNDKSHLTIAYTRRHVGDIERLFDDALARPSN